MICPGTDEECDCLGCKYGGCQGRRPARNVETIIVSAEEYERVLAVINSPSEPSEAAIRGAEILRKLPVPKGPVSRIIPVLAIACVLFAAGAQADEPVSATISTCFAPEQKCGPFIAAALDKAEHTLLFGAFNFTEGPVLDALLHAKQRGVDIKAIVDKTTPCEINAAIGKLHDAGVPVWIDRPVRIAHQKIAVGDGLWTVQGSYNFSGNADKNSENVNLVTAPEVAAAYTAHWTRRQAVSTPYEARVLFGTVEDVKAGKAWCKIKIARDTLATPRP